MQYTQLPLTVFGLRALFMESFVSYLSRQNDHIYFTLQKQPDCTHGFPHYFYKIPQQLIFSFTSFRYHENTTIQNCPVLISVTTFRQVCRLNSVEQMKNGEQLRKISKRPCHILKYKLSSCREETRKNYGICTWPIYWSISES